MCVAIISRTERPSVRKRPPMKSCGGGKGSSMAPLLFIFLTITSASAHGFSLEGLSFHRQCESDHQCDNGFYCYEESHLCTRCVDCASYKRRSSWRSCPKTPADCGGCENNYGEEILHNGRTRDMCVPSTPNNLSHTIVPAYTNWERLGWVAGITAFLLPLAYYVFARKNRIRDRGTIHHDLRREEPPPYRSIELTTLSTNNSEQLAEAYTMNVGQQKDQLVQAVPFQKPAYMDEELMAFDNTQNENSEDSDFVTNEHPVPTVSSVELQDENTMPSDWTPDENSNGQLMSFELDSEECEPAAKRHKTSETPDSEPELDNNTHNLSINLFINNNVTIHKPH
ncbi:uncharacterized protein LOC128992951 isoform X2 [Macrosteles quadrilineatus]|uniref:uncharacterized protein LOC128992951 isoform X2 n=1 Tax=Macrosteles quadrilineatus TaxID=74068 RepID=UPI0023E0F677|nr:uncharacterized protein LOC128992951 isoform X2 [Macrosteles quadrilineatus]